jgi:micrococcal nuclease
MSVTGRAAAAAAGLALTALVGACASDGDRDGDRCGPRRATVARVIDGDTIELAGGPRVRYLLVDTPEATGARPECFGERAARFNRDLVLDRVVDLDYEPACTDAFGRSLADVAIDGHSVSRILIERGYGCVLYVPPAGASHVAELRALEAVARAAGRGVWSACDPVPCS